MRASGSKLPLLRRCAYSMRPDVTLPPATSSDASIRGVARHVDFEAWINGTTVESCNAGEWPDRQAAKLRFLLEVSTRMGPAWHSITTEKTMVYDVLTGTTRHSPYRRTHEDPRVARPSEIRMTADAIGGDLVIDWKTGRPVHGAEEQTRALALAFARLSGRSTVRAALAYVDDAGRIWQWDEQTLDAFDLADAADWLRVLYEHEHEHQPRPGPWCRELYCPLAGQCPATAPALVVASGGGLVPSLDPQTPEEARALYLAREAVRAWDRDAHSALRRYVDTGRTIAIGDGREWGRVESRGSERVQLTAEGLAYLREVLPDAVEYGTTKTAINAALPPKGSAVTRKQVLARLGELGCLQSKTSTKYEEIEK